MTNASLLIDMPIKGQTLSSEQLTKNNQPIAMQKVAATRDMLLALRQLAYFTRAKDSDLPYDLLEALEKKLDEGAEVSVLIQLSEIICKACHIDIEKAVMKQSAFLDHYEKFAHSTFSHLFCKKLSKAEYFNYLNEQQRWLFIFVEILHTLVMPLLNLQQSGFSLNQGVPGLIVSINTQGAHVFIGQFGDNAHSQIHLVSGKNAISSLDNALQAQADSLKAIIVEQLKIIDETPMVLFRYPKEDELYMISYQHFSKRLQNFLSVPSEVENKEERYGIVSKIPQKLQGAA